MILVDALRSALVDMLTVEKSDDPFVKYDFDVLKAPKAPPKSP